MCALLEKATKLTYYVCIYLRLCIYIVLFPPPQDERMFTCACYMGTGQQLLYSCSDCSLTLCGQDTDKSFTVSPYQCNGGWCVCSVCCCVLVQGHTAPVTCLCRNRKDTLIVSGSENGRILLHEVSSPHLPFVLYQGQEQEVSHHRCHWPYHLITSLLHSPPPPPPPPPSSFFREFLLCVSPHLSQAWLPHAAVVVQWGYGVWTHIDWWPPSTHPTPVSLLAYM